VNTYGLPQLVIWAVVVQLLAFAVLPYVAWMCPKAPDRGYGWSKILGVFVFSGSAWLCSLCGLTSSNNLLITVVFGLFMYLGYRGYRSRWISPQDLDVILKQYAGPVECAFLGLTLFFGVVRFMNPEIFWGEKPMDSTFLNFFVRNEQLPPQDPWAAGSPMSYYYLGIYFMAALIKLTNIAPSVGYNLAMAMLAGWIGAALFSLLITLTRSKRFSTYGVWVLLLASNPELIRLSILNLLIGREFNFDTTFWPSTRVFVSPSFLEYTSWSLLFADLHAHVIAIPFTVTALGLATILFLDREQRYSSPGFFIRITLGSIVGALFGINTWDFISFGGVVGVMIALAKVPLFWKPPTNADGSPIVGEVVLVTIFTRLVALVWDFALVFGSAADVVWLYQHGVSFRPGGGWGWVSSHEFNSVFKLFRIIGYWLTGMILVVCVLAWYRDKTDRPIAVPHLLVGGLLFILAFVPPILSMQRGLENHPWATFTYCGILVALTYMVIWSNRGAEPESHALAVFMACAGSLIVILEIFFLLDRMNTLFKGYMAVWMLSGISTVVGSFYAYQAITERGSKRFQTISRWICHVFVGLTLIGASVNVYAVVRQKRVNSRHYTLDGIAYLRHMNPDDAALIAWLNSNVKGTPTILEAQGDAYREFTRISMHTGLPTVLGWEHHAKQRGLPEMEALARRKAIQAVYISEDVEVTKRLLLENRVDFIVVGSIERATYRRLDPTKFESHPELFTKVASFGATTLYVTYFSKFNPIYRGGLTQ
jgi:YYY domain-containing protein